MTPFEINNNTTASYEEIVAYYDKLGKQESYVTVSNYGATDIGEPLQEVIVDKDGLTSPETIRKAGKAILFINNGIHPGEPCGIDACMMLVRDIKNNPTLWGALDNMSIVIVPVYNIDGAINRNSHTRTNQVGPEAYGFRGNSRNFDLNRDFIKCDTKNAESFNHLFTKWSPDIMIDTHTSNGADYQYVMTLISSQKDRLPPSLASYLTKDMLPYLYEKMEADRYPMIPYVNVNETPDDGIYGFLDYARYSSGYAALHHTISFMPETHMLKPFKDRVWSTYDFIKHSIELIHRDANKIMEARKQAIDYYKTEQDIALDWELDATKKDMISFDGFTAKRKASDVSGIDRLYYDRNEPYTKEIPYYNDYKANLNVQKPTAYVVPQAYGEIISRLKWNGVELTLVEEAKTLEAEMYYITVFETVKSPYEGHYLHSNIQVEKVNRSIQVRAGDYIVYLNQAANRYIMETLEPQAPDSYFAWNFLDAIIQQKEYFSSYVFEDLAAEYLKNDPQLKADLEAKKLQDVEFASNARAQLDFIYKRTAHYEYTHRLYPIARIVNP